MLYTNNWGERRIRIMNFKMNVTKNLNTYFKAADVETASQFIIKRELSKMTLRGPRVVREHLTN